MRKNLTTAALALVLCCPAFAGIMHTPGSSQPQPTPTPAVSSQAPTEGETTEGETHEPGVSDTLTEILLGLLAALPPLL